MLNYLHAKDPALLRHCLAAGDNRERSIATFVAGREAATLVALPRVQSSLEAQSDRVAFRDIAPCDVDRSIRVDAVVLERGAGVVAVAVVEDVIGNAATLPGRLRECEAALLRLFHRAIGVTIVLWGDLQKRIENLLPQIEDDFFAVLFRDLVERLERPSRDGNEIETGIRRIVHAMTNIEKDFGEASAEIRSALQRLQSAVRQTVDGRCTVFLLEELLSSISDPDIAHLYRTFSSRSVDQST